MVWSLGEKVPGLTIKAPVDTLMIGIGHDSTMEVGNDSRRDPSISTSMFVGRVSGYPSILKDPFQPVLRPAQ